MWSFQGCSFATAGSPGLLAPQCLVGIDCLLDLPTFHLWEYLEEHGYDRTGPERPTEGVKQVGQESEQPGLRRQQQNVSPHMSGQADHEAEHKALVQKALP